MGKLKLIIVIRFGKTCTVHTSNFSVLETHKICLEWQIDVKLSGILEPLFLHHYWKFHICLLFLVVFMDLQMSKIGCVNYACFPKSSHNYWLLVSSFIHSDVQHLSIRRSIAIFWKYCHMIQHVSVWIFLLIQFCII